MRSNWVRATGGQAIIVVALSLLVLIGMLALVIDLGYGMTQRRVMVNAAESAALSVGKLLATHVARINGQLAFTVGSTQVIAEANRIGDANRSFAAPSGNYRLEVWFGNETAPASGNWKLAVGGDAVPRDTVYVRTRSSVVYRTFVAQALGFQRLEAAGTATARLSGSDYVPQVPAWPMVRHYNAADFDQSCPDPCTNLPPVLFWSGSPTDSPSVVFGSFKGLTDLSRYSSYENGNVAQLISDWDRRGHDPNRPLPDASGNCARGWDTAGNENDSNHNKQCSIPNWFRYGYGGTLSLTADWRTPPSADQEAPSAIGPRPGVCAIGRRPVIAPSCANSNVGDWMEIANGDMATNMSDAILAAIRSTGPDGGMIDPARSDQFIPGTTTKFGRALVRLVYMWDCAETYQAGKGKSKGAGQWDLIAGTGGDCSQIERGDITRVHLFTVAPFIFYEGLVSSQEIRGYWGIGFGDASSCRVCPQPLNTVSNSAYLIGDE